MISHALLVICILVSAAVLGDATAAYKPTDLFLINCGATSYTNDTGNRTWTVEFYWDHSPWNSEELSFAAKASYQDVAASPVPFRDVANRSYCVH